MTGFVLVETLASERQGKTLWYREMTDVGPATTPNIEERHVFSTEDYARQCPAMYHSFSFFEVQPA